ncbi:MAG: hypothetical protein V8T45_07405 [Oscillospiraceae bacterium]
MDMLDMWTEESSQRLDKSIAYQHEALLKCFAAYEKLGLEGGVLHVRAKSSASALGSSPAPAASTYILKRPTAA